MYALSFTVASSLIECIPISGAPISITGIVKFAAVTGPIVVPPLKSDLLTNFWNGTLADLHTSANTAPLKLSVL